MIITWDWVNQVTKNKLIGHRNIKNKVKVRDGKCWVVPMLQACVCEPLISIINNKLVAKSGKGEKRLITKRRLGERSS